MKAQVATMMLSAAFVLAMTGGAAQTRDREPSTRRLRINGTFIDATNGQGVFSGIIQLTRFDVENTSVVAVGTLVGALIDSRGEPLAGVDREVAVPITGIESTCDLLRLDLGPAVLEIVGRLVHLRKDVVGITPRDGPGQPLSTRLCSFTNLLDSRTTLSSIAAALNDILVAMRSPN